MRSAELRELLARNVALMQRAQTHDGRIRDAAHQELDSVNKRLAAMPPGMVALDLAMGEKYQRLVMDRARLHRLLGAQS